MNDTSGGLGGGGFKGFERIPLWAASSTDERLSGPPLSLATELRQLLLWLTLAWFSKKNSFANVSIGLVVSLKNDQMGVVLPQSGHSF
jgi:hypothetical protein